MLELAHACLHNKNFSAVLEIVNGLNSPSLSRLQFFWERIINDSDILRLSRLRMTAETNDNNKQYRFALNRVGPDTQAIPSLTIALKDLSALHLASKSILSKGVNVEKILSMQKVIDEFLKVLFYYISTFYLA